VGGDASNADVLPLKRKRKIPDAEIFIRSFEQVVRLTSPPAHLLLLRADERLTLSKNKSFSFSLPYKGRVGRLKSTL
jgi:hypothetical protein